MLVITRAGGKTDKHQLTSAPAGVAFFVIETEVPLIESAIVLTSTDVSRFAMEAVVAGQIFDVRQQRRNDEFIGDVFGIKRQPRAQNEACLVRAPLQLTGRRSVRSTAAIVSSALTAGMLRENTSLLLRKACRKPVTNLPRRTRLSTLTDRMKLDREEIQQMT